jgi:hypothetical protein
MTSNLKAKISLILNPPHPRDAVHFHLRHDGRPFVCDLSRCDSPALTLNELDA